MKSSAPFAVTLQQANRKIDSLVGTRWDVVVIGAGPAGAFAAYKLARRGLAVLLVEKQLLPRYKVCGCCLSHASLQLLAELAPELLALQPKSTHEMRLFVDSKDIALPIPQGLSLSREILDSFLTINAIRSGATFSMGVTAKVDPIMGAELRKVSLYDQGAEAGVFAGCVLVADGLNGLSLSNLPHFNAVVDVRQSKIGAGAISTDKSAFRDGIIYMACADEGYVGAVVVEDGAVNIAAAISPRSSRGGGSMAAAVSHILESTGMPVPEDLLALDWKGTVALTRKRKQLADERIFVIGDSAAYVEPFTGEGMLWALSTATAVGDFAVQASRAWRPELADDWQLAHTKSIQRRQLICKTVAGILRHPTLMHPCGTILSAAPYVVKPIVAAMNQPPVWEVLAS